MGYGLFIVLRVMGAFLLIAHVKSSASNIDSQQIDVINTLRRKVDLLNKLHATRDLGRADIVDHLLQSGARDSDMDKPSTAYMLGVFERLLQGERLAAATGHTTARTPRRLGHADTVRSFSAKHADQDFSIHIPVLPNNEKANYAEMRFRGPFQLHQKSQFRIRVYEGNSHRLLHKHKVSFKMARDGGDHIADISRVVLPQINNINRNLSLTFKFDNFILKNHHIRFDSDQVKPILVLYSEDKQFMKEFYNRYNDHKGNRYKRDVIESDSSNKKGRKRRRNRWRKNKSKHDICQLYDFKVDFDLIGWGPWIIHPKTFNSKVCYGRCPEPIATEFTPTNHAMLQTLMRMKRPLVAPEPCCVPTKLRPLSMLYFEYEDIVVRHHEDMVAAACGCR